MAILLQDFIQKENELSTRGADKETEDPSSASDGYLCPYQFFFWSIDRYVYSFVYSCIKSSQSLLEINKAHSEQERV